jgi:hypothetical protein
MNYLQAYVGDLRSRVVYRPLDAIAYIEPKRMVEMATSRYPEICWHHNKQINKYV